MTKVGFISTPLTNGHALRGVGFYTRYLLDYLQKNASRYGFEIINTQSSSSFFDLVHYPYFDLFSHTLPLKKITKTVITVHDVVPLEFPDHYPPGLKGRFNLALQKISLNNASGIITDSLASVNSIHKYLGVPHKKIKLVYLAASETYQNKKPAEKIIQKYSLPEKFVLYVGDVNWNKNLPALIRSCLDLNIDLILVGKQAALAETLNANHPELQHVSELISLFKSPLVHRLGFIPDEELAEIYNAATIYCQPSYAEGFGIPVLEAMACGTPVVSSNSHSLPEIAGDAAVYFDPNDQNDIRQKLSQILSDSGLRKDLSQKGIIQSKKFSWDLTAKNTLLAYQSFI